jgi:hypothetical protein
MMNFDWRSVTLRATHIVLWTCGLSLASVAHAGTSAKGTVRAAAPAAPVRRATPAPPVRPGTTAPRVTPGVQRPAQPGYPIRNPRVAGPPTIPNQQQRFARPGMPAPYAANVPVTRTSLPQGGRAYHLPNETIVTKGNPRTGREVSVVHNNGVAQTQHFAPGVPRTVQTVRPAPGGGQVVVTSYGRNNVSVVRPIMGRPGFYRHSYYVDGRTSVVVYRNYQYYNVSYARPVPAVVYAPAFYSWGFQPWSTPVAYGWGWNSQPWYQAYGGAFTPYPTYGSLDLWMTDYVIASNMQRAYASSQQPPAGSGFAQPMPAEAEAYAPPPTITPEMKQQIAGQVRLQMQEQQQMAAQGPAAVAGPAPLAASTDTTLPQDLPDALRPGHTIFRVVSPLSVQANGQSCSLNANDYITRTSDMDKNTGLVQVTVTASRSVDCARGSTVRIAVNDLMVMDSDQQERIQDGLQLASNSMGKNGLPAGPNPGATAVPLGQAVADSGLPDTMRQQQLDADQDLQQAAAVAGTGF